MLNQGKPVYITRRTTNEHFDDKHAVRSFTSLLANKASLRGDWLTDPLHIDANFSGLITSESADETVRRGKEYAVAILVTPELISAIGNNLGIVHQTMVREHNGPMPGAHAETGVTMLADLNNDDLIRWSSEEKYDQKAYGIASRMDGRELTDEQRILLFQHTIILENMVRNGFGEMFVPVHIGSEAIKSIPRDEMEFVGITEEVLEYFATHQEHDVTDYRDEMSRKQIERT